MPFAFFLVFSFWVCETRAKEKKKDKKKEKKIEE